MTPRKYNASGPRIKPVALPTVQPVVSRPPITVVDPPRYSCYRCDAENLNEKHMATASRAARTGICHQCANEANIVFAKDDTKITEFQDIFKSKKKH